MLQADQLFERAKAIQPAPVTDADRTEMAIGLFLQGYTAGQAAYKAFVELEDNDGALQMLARHRCSSASWIVNADKPLRIDWNQADLAEAYDLVEGVRREAAQDPESSIDSSLRYTLDAIESADCEWDNKARMF